LEWSSIQRKAASRTSPRWRGSGSRRRPSEHGSWNQGQTTSMAPPSRWPLRRRRNRSPSPGGRRHGQHQGSATTEWRARERSRRTPSATPGRDETPPRKARRQPLAPAAPQTEIARFREGPSGNVVVTRGERSGNRSPRPRPWTARAPKQQGGCTPSPPTIDATPNSAADAMRAASPADRRASSEEEEAAEHKGVALTTHSNRVPEKRAILRSGQPHVHIEYRARASWSVAALPVPREESESLGICLPEEIGCHASTWYRKRAGCRYQ